MEISGKSATRGRAAYSVTSDRAIEVKPASWWRHPALPDVDWVRYRGPALHLPDTVVSVDYGIALCDGGFEATRRGTRQVLTKGVFCVQPGDAITFHRQRSTLTELRALLLEPSTLQDAASELGVNTAAICNFATTDLRLYDTIEAVWQSASADSTLAVQSAFFELSRVILELAAGSDLRRVPTVSPTAIQRARDLILTSAERDLTLDELATEVGLSKTYFVRAFRQAFGMTPYAYLMHVRVDRARHLLRKGWRPIDVASEFGFCDQSHLHRRFMKVTGVSPKAYAKAAAPVLSAPSGSSD